ncbi:uncharacterized protein LOC117115637 [Anneissia japonica]|uniref:uncharacterized protein LOC117115637 n=1 Tax=Anneissia japonica TaxID=1529436 RepID=UPI0014257C69|nr:uncharacterized protein LOC117115637 [Anneissia japonica]
MYHRIGIPESDQHVHRFLWRNFDQSKKPDIYVKTNVTFGDKPAPAMAQIALRKTAMVNEKIHPEAARIITKDSYMDDILTSVSNQRTAERLADEIDTVLYTGGFKVKQWTSNANLTNTENNQPLKQKAVLSDDSEQKVLGVVWNPVSDMLLYKVKTPKFPGNRLTKRMVLSELAKVFDPIGFATAFLIRGKIMMQRLWQQGYGWDDDMSESEKANGESFLQSFKA